MLCQEENQGPTPPARRVYRDKAYEKFDTIVTINVGLFNNNGGFPGWEGPYLTDEFLDSSGAFIDPWGMPYFLDCDYKIDGDDHVVVGSFGPNKVGMNNYDSDNLYVIVSTDWVD